MLNPVPGASGGRPIDGGLAPEPDAEVEAQAAAPGPDTRTDDEKARSNEVRPDGKLWPIPGRYGPSAEAQGSLPPRRPTSIPHTQPKDPGGQDRVGGDRDADGELKYWPIGGSYDYFSPGEF